MSYNPNLKPNKNVRGLPRPNRAAERQEAGQLADYVQRIKNRQMPDVDQAYYGWTPNSEEDEKEDSTARSVCSSEKSNLTASDSTLASLSDRNSAAPSQATSCRGSVGSISQQSSKPGRRSRRGRQWRSINNIIHDDPEERMRRLAKAGVVSEGNMNSSEDHETSASIESTTKPASRLTSSVQSEVTGVLARPARGKQSVRPWDRRQALTVENKFAILRADGD